jgi:predicted N-acyltransferase
VGHRRAYPIRKEMRRFAAAGYELAVEPLSQCWYEAGPLVANVQQKYGHADTADDCRAGLRTQAEALDRHSLVFTARRRGRLVGCALFYAWRTTLHGRVVGFDYPALSNAAEYFNLLFYEPLRYAYEHGYAALRLGISSYEAKVGRGARAAPLWAMFRPPPAAALDWRHTNRLVLGDWQRPCRLEDIDIPPEWVAGDEAD